MEASNKGTTYERTYIRWAGREVIVRNSGGEMLRPSLRSVVKSNLPPLPPLLLLLWIESESWKKKRMQQMSGCCCLSNRMMNDQSPFNSHLLLRL
jgi:hypothetical protein